MATSSARLQIAAQVGRSVVTEATSRTPLRLLQPRNHGHAAWVYQSSHGGGLVGRDDVSLDVEVEANGTLFLSSQSSTKVYSDADACFRLDAEVGEHATLVAWPDPLVCFAGASFVQRQRYALAPTANLVCVDAYGAGRVERGERWAFSRLRLELEVTVGGARALRDALLLDAMHGDLRARLAPFDAYATVVLVGPRVVEMLDRVEESTPPSLDHALVTLSRRPWGAVLRLGARDMQTLSARLRMLLGAHVARLLGDDPWKRKW